MQLHITATPWRQQQQRRRRGGMACCVCSVLALAPEAGLQGSASAYPRTFVIVWRRRHVGVQQDVNNNNNNKQARANYSGPRSIAQHFNERPLAVRPRRRTSRIHQVSGHKSSNPGINRAHGRAHGHTPTRARAHAHTPPLSWAPDQ